MADVRDLLKHTLGQVAIEDVWQALLHAVGGATGASCADVVAACPAYQLDLTDAMVALARRMEHDTNEWLRSNRGSK